MKPKKDRIRSDIYDLGRLKIDATVLVSILKKFSKEGHVISAETDEYEFVSIEDMESNLPQVVKCEVIKIGDVELKFGPFLGAESLSYCILDNDNDIDDTRVLFDNIKIELSLYNRWSLSPWVRFSTTILATMVINSILESQFYALVENNDLRLIGSALTALLLFISIFYIYGKVIGKSGIYYNPRETIVQRHFGDIIKICIGSVIGALVTTWIG